MTSKIKTNINSEVGELEAVLLHRPGTEVEKMTPENAASALYSDILSLNVAQSEYQQLEGVLNTVCQTYQIKDLLSDVMAEAICREKLVHAVCQNESKEFLLEYLMNLDSKELATSLIEGVPMKKDSLTRYLDTNRYALNPLHNFFFTRDASVAFNNQVLINKMASTARDREPLIMEAIFDFHQLFTTSTFSPRLRDKAKQGPLSIEGGDVLIAREDLLIIGMGGRTTSQGIDFLIDRFKTSHRGKKQHLIVQELPLSPESFIHLDMVFTLLSQTECMVFEPLIMHRTRYRCMHIEIDDGQVAEINEYDNLMMALQALGMELKPICCGGSDEWMQEREQWHSGTNFFAFAPGKVIGYARNTHTVEEMAKHDYKIIPALEVLAGRVNLKEEKKCLVTIEGSELSRGGGGARCMTMPIARKDLSW